MDPPFTVEQFLGVFGRYNQAVWPAQTRPGRGNDRAGDGWNGPGTGNQ